MTLYNLSRQSAGSICGEIPDGDFSVLSPLNVLVRPMDKISSRKKILVLGNFDGVHLGHRRLISEACRYAGQLSLKSGSEVIPAVLTFESHYDKKNYTEDNELPSDEKMPDNSEFPSFISTKEEKLRLFASLGIKEAYFENFDDIRTYPPEKFVNDILIEKYGCAAAVCGFNYRFGYLGRGTPEMLAEMLAEHGAGLITVGKVCLCGIPVSSTRIRAALCGGRCAEAAALLGRYFDVRLEVIHGRELGRKIDIPTVNQRFLPNQVIPKFGVYAGLCDIGDGKIYGCVTNVGIRPTITENDYSVNCESHIIGYSGNLYGKTVTVYFIKYLRPEKKFGSVEQLRSAIARNIDQTKQLLNLK